MPFVTTWMGLETVILSELNQTEEEKYHMTCLIYRTPQKIIQMKLFTKQKQSHREQNYGCQGGRMGGQIS